MVTCLGRSSPLIYLVTNIEFVHCSDSLRKYADMPTLGKKSYSREHPKGLPLRQWLQLRIPIIAEHNTVTSNYILPPEMMTRKEIREMYICECGLQPLDPSAIQKSRFNEILKVWLSRTKLSCKVCVHAYFQNLSRTKLSCKLCMERYFQPNIAKLILLFRMNFATSNF